MTGLMLKPWRCWGWALALTMALTVPAWSQTLEPSDDFDVIAVPIGPSLSPQNADFGAPVSSMFDLGFTPQAVPKATGGTYPWPSSDRIQVSQNRIQIELRPGEAVRFNSQPVVTSATSVYFTSFLTVEHQKPSQAAIALWDLSTDAQLLGVSLTMPGDLTLNQRREFAYEYQPKDGPLQLLLQFLGPDPLTVDQSTIITLERIRLIPGYRSLDFVLGAGAVTPVERFSPFPETYTEDRSITTVGGYIAAVTKETRQPRTYEASQCLQLAAKTDDDIIRMNAPLTIRPITPGTLRIPGVLTAQMYMKRRSGEKGIVSIALGSVITGSLGVYEIPAGMIPTDRWMRFECPIQYNHDILQAPFLFLQLRGGAAQILIDDLSLQTNHDPVYLWDASLVTSR
ncbi:MAG: hypothetical protein GC154_14415 [bacterium]|nr:hypothetical protein [bacterium]